MSIEIKSSLTRGKSQMDWLLSHHSFSFADYYSPENHHFSILRVINEDFIAGGGGFGTHPHKDMEIITFVVSGELEHKDTLGNSTVIRPGEIQRMTAGSGIFHSEFNPDPKQSTHIFQIWLLPSAKGLAPSYDQKSYLDLTAHNAMQFLAGPNSSNSLIKLNAEAKLYLLKLEAKQKWEFKVDPAECAWIQIISGTVQSSSGTLSTGDALKIRNEKTIHLECNTQCQALVFLLPA